MTLEGIKLKLEELEIPSDKIDELILFLEKEEDKKPIFSGNSKLSQRLELTDRLREETDWRKKAALAARIINLEIDKYNAIE